MKKLYYLSGLILFVLFVRPVHAQNSILNPTKDAYVSSAAPTTNYGTATDLLVKVSASGSADRKVYIGFDLTGKSTSYNQIVLKVVKTGGDDAALMIRSASTSWTESAITWDAKPANGNNMAHGGYRIGDTLVFDITAYIKSKINNSQFNINLEIYTEDNITSPLALASRENTTAQKRPVLCFYSAKNYDISTFKFINTTASVVDKGDLAATNIDNITSTSAVDIYGGWTGAKFSATGFFRTEYSCGKWYMVDPLGNMFLMAALNSIEQGGGISLPKALKDLGVNTMGKWSDEAIDNIPYCPGMDFMLNFKNKRTELTDMYNNSILPVFETDFPAYCDARAKILAARYVTDPYVIGYFLDNELPFYKDQLKAGLALATTNNQWIAANAWMKAKYGAGYTTSQITETDELVYQGYVCDKYYEIVSAAVKKYDPNHLLLGTRFHGAAKRHEYIMQAAGKYCDMISVNYYGEWEPDNTKLDMWLEKGNKPFFISEFYVKGNDLGLANDNGAGWVVATQNDRAIFFENFVLKLLKHPGCVGYHWFRYIDNNATNKGILSENYTWFKPMVDAFKRINLDIYRLRSQLWFGNVNYNGKIDCAHNMCGTTTMTNPGAVTGGSSPIKEGSSTNVMTLTNYSGTISLWQKQYQLTGGTYSAWTDISNTQSTYSEIPPYKGNGTWKYRVQVQDGDCPPAFSASRLITVQPVVTGIITENNQIAFKIYPNPASNLLIIEGLNMNIKNITISNALGQVVLEQNSKDSNALQIDISMLMAGNYFITIGDQVQKLFISK